MKKHKSIHRTFVAALMLGASSIAAAPMTASAQNYTASAQRLSPQELDSLTAPIALYSDQLLADFLMAASYPDEVQEAAQWLAEPRNAALRGDALARELDSMDRDPSIKALTMVPGILQMMDNRIDWTARLGDAFVSQRDDVMDSVQRLRREAYANGRLRSNAHQRVVVTESEKIAIEPVSSDSLYFSVYNPLDMYGPWPYPDYPPVYLAPPVGYGLVTGYEYGLVFPIFTPFWGWNRWDWRHHRVRIDPGRFHNIDHNHHVVGTTWQHDPSHDFHIGLQSGGQGQRTWSERNGSGQTGDVRNRRGPVTVTGQPPAATPTGQTPAQEDRRTGRWNRGATSDAAPTAPVNTPPASNRAYNPDDRRGQDDRRGGGGNRGSHSDAAPVPPISAPTEPQAHQPGFRERDFTAPANPPDENRQPTGQGRSFRERNFQAPPPVASAPPESTRVPIARTPVPSAPVPLAQPPAFAGNNGGGYHPPAAPPPVITAAPPPAPPPPAAPQNQGNGNNPNNPNNPNAPRYGRESGLAIIAQEITSLLRVRH